MPTDSFNVMEAVDTFVTVNTEGRLVTAVVIDEVGNVVKGHARCSPEDVWNEEYGIDLAVARAESRYANRQLKRILAESR